MPEPFSQSSPQVLSSLENAPAPLLDELGFRQHVRRAALVPAALLATLTAALLALTFYLVRNAEWVEHRRSVIAQLHAVEKLAVDMETGLRGFQVTTDPHFLEPYRVADQRIDGQLAALRSLVGETPAQSTEAAGLETAFAAWRGFAAETLAILEAGGRADAPSFNGQGKKLMDQIRTRVGRVVNEEERLRAARASTLRKVRYWLLGLIVAGLGAGGPLGWWWLRGVLRQIRSAYRQSLLDAEGRARELAVTLHSIGDAVISTNPAGEVTLLNPVAERLLGWSSAEARGKSLGEVFPIFSEDTGAPAENPVDRVLRERVVVGLANHTILRTRDGREVPIEDSAAPIINEAGELVGVVLVFHDVMEKRERERQLVFSEARFRTLADNMAQLAWIAEEDGHISWYNERWFEYTGTTLEEMQGLGWQKVNHPDHVERVTTEFLRRAKAGEAWEDTFPLRAKNGEFRWFLSRARPMRDAVGNTVRWFGTNTDITAQRELSEELARAQQQTEMASRAKDNFLAALSHELRTPLTPVLMTVAALADDERLSDEFRGQLAVVQRNIELEVRLIDDLLDITRIARGVLPLRPQLCDAHSLIGLAVEIVRDDSQTKRQELNLQLSAKRTGFIADPARLQQLFWNLFRNAVKFTPIGGRITIRTRDTEEGLLIEVSDTGIGIQPEALERIFLPFEQGGLTNDHRFGGLGLGLSIARAIVDLHGGTIVVTSEGSGHGATFCVNLPGAAEPPQGTTPETPEEGAPAAHALSNADPLRLLLVEDHEPTVKVLHRLLSRAGHQVVVANTVAAALAAAECATFDAVVSDLGLPDGTGFELMQILSSKYHLRGVALSGYGMEDDLRRSKEAGFITHLVKPIEINQLRQALRQLSTLGATDSADH